MSRVGNEYSRFFLIYFVCLFIIAIETTCICGLLKDNMDRAQREAGGSSKSDLHDGYIKDINDDSASGGNQGIIERLMELDRKLMTNVLWGKCAELYKLTRNRNSEDQENGDLRFQDQETVDLLKMCTSILLPPTKHSNNKGFRFDTMDHSLTILPKTVEAFQSDDDKNDA